MSSVEWNDQSPIYKQLKARVLVMLLDGTLPPGGGLPSVRQLAADYQLNPITVSRAYQELADEGLIEKRRGVGMFVSEAGPAQALKREREVFINEQWPQALRTAARLGLSASVLVKALNQELGMKNDGC